MLLDTALIRSGLSESQNIVIEVQACRDSSHQDLKSRLASDQLCFPHVLLVEQQRQGVGQGNKSWYSPPGENIYLSCAWSFPRKLVALQGVTLVVGLAVIHALRQLDVAEDIGIKWPNDIFYQERKLAGILVDVEARMEQQSIAVISIGLNVNMTAATNAQIDKPWTSLHLIQHRYFERNQVAGMVINSLCNYLAQFIEHGFASFLEEWHHYDYLLQKPILLKHAQDEQLGIARGVDIHGRLLHLTPDGRITAYASAEVLCQHVI